ncbi:unnamed protein product [Chrysodeixis includens]|uniref:RING-type E3 ubiquitin transferase n=1 Tax=Chrysodeixis includens TaxID=689277 RepID=A0A9P0FT00_CHRIL|nr:unnamed protein product [Chrysodeixis includens]
MNDSQSNENTCVVCFKNVLYYSIGECDHPVCFECSTRMRVLCLQNECPICRRDLSRVVFTETVQPYKELRNRVFTDRLFERQFKIGFCSEDIKLSYETLLENRCKICDKIPPFRTFTMLSDHMRKVHERYFCDLCVKHLKIFTMERKCYTRQELAHHRRRGDVDDTSHRGHPLCEFCEERFMDADELYRHLRKEHLYCHLCDADGRNLYYASHSALAHHFRTDHYLCEEGECAGQHLTAVFRSEIDLKAHKATVHGRGMPRGAARQARTLELQFNITPHPVQRTPRDHRGDHRDRREQAEAVPAPVVQVAPQADIDTRSDEQFPRLSAAPAATGLVLSAPHRAYKGVDGLKRNDKNFPALDGAAGPSRAPRPAGPAPTTVAATIVRNSKPSVSIPLQGQPTSASNFRLTQTSGNRITIPHQQKMAALCDDDFPSLSVGRDDHPSLGAATMQPPKVALINSQAMQALKNEHPSYHNKKQPPQSAEAFPALSSTSAPVAPPQWITVSKSKDKQKPAKPEPPPKKEPAFNAVADFPTLPVNLSKSKSKKQASQPQQQQQQQQQAPAQTNDNTKLSKKEKKKQNSKKENLADMYHVNGTNDKKIIRESYASVNMNNNQPGEDKNIKTVEAPTTERNRNGGNGDFNLAAKDYPPLNSRSDNCLPGRKLANGSVPPGFVPPGFKPRPPCDGMTFTNSSGQTFPAPLHSYIPPPEFEQRNRALVKKFSIALGGDEAVENFRVASRAFRDSSISAEQFHQHCRAALGSQFDEVFPELVALLPDIAKQQELMVGRSAGVAVCRTCGQLLAPHDARAHHATHWPPLH